jgi:uncharacterized protein YraI
MHLKQLWLALGLLLASAGAAAASPAVVSNDLKMRSGPGTNFGVVSTMPAGATVNVFSCSGAWCRVAWGNRQGFVSRSYLEMGGGAYPVYGAAPPPVVIYGGGFGWGWGPGWGWGGGWRGGWHGGWHGGHGGWHHH